MRPSDCPHVRKMESLDGPHMRRSNCLVSTCFKPYGFVVGAFAQQALQGKSLTVYGDGQQTRDFVHVSDNVRLAIAAAESEAANGRIINIGTGQETRILDLAEQLAALTKSQRSQSQPSSVFKPKRVVEIQRRCADTSLMESVLQDTCKKRLEDQLPAVLHWYQDTTEAVVG